MKVKNREVTLNDKKIIKALKRATRDFEDGAIVEARDTLRDIMRALGRKSVPGISKRINRCDAASGPDRHKMVSRLHSASCGDTFHPRSAKIWGRQKLSSVSVHGGNIPKAGKG